SVIGITMLAVLSLTPIGEQIVALLPFIGSYDAGRGDFPQKLFYKAIIIIGRYLILGSVGFFVSPGMQRLLYAECIIDIVNTYLRVALNAGLVGLGLFCGFFVTILIGLRRVLKMKAVRNTQLHTCARASIAVLIAMLFTIFTVSSTSFIPYVYWSFS